MSTDLIRYPDTADALRFLFRSIYRVQKKEIAVRNEYIVFETLLEHDTRGAVKGVVLEWACPNCHSNNFRILLRPQREPGDLHTRCRFCRAKYRVEFAVPKKPVEGEAEFLRMLEDEEFSEDEQKAMIEDFAEIATMKAEKAAAAAIRERQKVLDQRIAIARKRIR